MRALSVKQPWAWLICAGYKDVENRNWHIGRHGPYQTQTACFCLELPMRIYIHAGKILDKDGLDWLLESESSPVTEDDLFKQLIERYYYGNPDDRSKIIGEVDIVDCVSKHDSKWFTGPYGFVLANPKLYDAPIPYSGKLGFFEVDLGAKK